MDSSLAGPAPHPQPRGGGGHPNWGHIIIQQLPVVFLIRNPDWIWIQDKQKRSQKRGGGWYFLLEQLSDKACGFS